MKRDTTIVVVLLAALLVVGITGHRLTGTTVLLLAVLVPSVILHEVAHGVVAMAYGDDTAKRAGRLTLNPIKHVDPLGTIVLPVILALSGFAVFGYAKPVPVNPRRMRDPRNNSLVVSLAGPATNVALAVLALVFLRWQHPFLLSTTSGPLTQRVPYLFGIINVVLAVFNMIPIPPFDGSAVIERFLPDNWRSGWARVRQYGLPVFVVIVLLRPQVLSRLFNPAFELWARGLGP